MYVNNVSVKTTTILAGLAVKNMLALISRIPQLLLLTTVTHSSSLTITCLSIK